MYTGDQFKSSKTNLTEEGKEEVKKKQISGHEKANVEYQHNALNMEQRRTDRDAGGQTKGKSQETGDTTKRRGRHSHRREVKSLNQNRGELHKMKQKQGQRI